MMVAVVAVVVVVAVVAVVVVLSMLVKRLASGSTCRTRKPYLDSTAKLNSKLHMPRPGK